MNISSNIGVVVRAQISRLKNLEEQADQCARTVALAVLPEIRKRVHVEGKDSSGNQIGTYSNRYLKMRTSTTRKTKYNRTSDPKVILSLTRQMENDESVIATGKNSYGIGFKNRHNFDKSQWNEATFKKKIWNLTTQEKELAQDVAEAFVHSVH